jgi:hypothetical protein
MDDDSNGSLECDLASRVGRHVDESEDSNTESLLWRRRLWTIELKLSGHSHLDAALVDDVDDAECVVFVGLRALVAVVDQRLAVLCDVLLLYIIRRSEYYEYEQ